MMKKILKKLNENKNLPLILFIFTGLLSEGLLRALTLKSVFYWKPFVASIGILIALSMIPLLLDYKKNRRIFIGLSFLVAIISGANYLYYKHFDSYISLSIIQQVKFLFEMDGSVASALDLKLLLFLVLPLGYTFAMKGLERAGYFERMGKRCIRRNFFRPIAFGLLCLAMVLVTLTSTDFSRLSKQWNRPYIVEQLGLYSYTLADAVKSLMGPSVVAVQLNEDEANRYIDNLIDTNVQEKEETIESTEYCKDIFVDRDVYIIHYESAQSFPMDLEFEDGSVTPFLNKMADEGLTFNNFYPQHSVGTSSDTEFTFNTSLFPINNGTVFMSHSDRKFVTLQSLLGDEGYYSVSMHGNNGDFWNRNVMHKTLGYDRYFSKNDYIVDEEIGLGLSDKSFFNQSVEKLKDLKKDQEKLVATLISLTNHYPFDDVESMDEFDVGHLEGSIIGNYLKSYHYADQALESFIGQMEEEGLLDNAVVVLYGDHHAQLSMEDYQLLYYGEENGEHMKIDPLESQKLKRTPFIIWTKDQAIDLEVEKPMGMVDALPTLSNMLGIFNEYQLGVDIMNKEKNTVVFPDASWINEDYYFCASTGLFYDQEGNEVEENVELLREREKTEEKLLLSNEIINSDLIKTHRRGGSKGHMIK